MVVFHTIKEKCGVFSKSIYYRRSMVDCARMGILRRDMVFVLEWEFQGGDMVDCVRLLF